LWHDLYRLDDFEETVHKFRFPNHCSEQMKEAHLHDREDGRTLQIHFSHEQFLVRQTASLTSFSYAPPG
jgi:hypothetical protein